MDERYNDRDHVLAAVKEDVRQLQYASEELRNNRDFVLEAVRQNSDAFQYISETFQNDPEIRAAAGR